MLTPEYLSDVADATENSIAAFNTYLLNKLARSLNEIFMRDGEIDGFMTKHVYEMRKLEAAGMLFEDIQKEIEKRLPWIRNEVRKAFDDAREQTITDSDAFIADVVKDAQVHGALTDVDIPENGVSYGMTAKELRLLEYAYRRTNGSIMNITGTTAQTARGLFEVACDEAWFKVNNGTDPNTAIVEGIDKLSQKGITTVGYGSGRADKIEVAIARCVRTGVSQANGDITLTRCAELGVGNVITSQHVGARVTQNDDYTNHSWWQGKVYSLDFSGPLSKYALTDKEAADQAEKHPEFSQIKEYEQSMNADKYPDFVETCGYGDILGICGINCRHSFSPFYPGMKNNNPPIDSAQNKKAYELSQKQRAMERRIREIKRDIEALKACGNTSDVVNDRIAELKALLNVRANEYAIFCQANNLSRANWRLKISE